ncbi:MAG TPA: MBL fold metallo-hydrolase [Tepidisphaeraceae bacterium]|jgi:phosphoribosyl 1,2-cyclic phosphodiesterase
MSYPNPLHIDRPDPQDAAAARFAGPLRAMELCVLGSGSSGNCSLVRSPGGVLMLDAGLGPRTLAKRLSHPTAADDRRISLDDVSAVCLTHLDSDHFNANLLATLERLETPVWCHTSRAAEGRARAAGKGCTIDVHAFDEYDAFEPVPGIAATAVSCAHDVAGSHGFRLDWTGGGNGGSIGYATDLGCVPAALLDHFCDLDVLAIESNYDRQMQLNSPRPSFLKHRIMNGSGHLSNAEAYAAVRELFDRCERRGKCVPKHVVLLHRSRECNCPDLLRKFFSRDKRLAKRLILSDPFEPTPWLRTGPGVGEQMTLAWG